MLARGLDPSDWLRAQENRGAMVRTGDAGRDGLLWPEAVAAFLAAKSQDRSPHTITDYRYALNAPGLRGRFDQRPIRSIRPAEVPAVVREIAASGRKAQAQHVLRVIKSLFSWAAQEEVLGEDEAVSPVALVNSAPSAPPMSAPSSGRSPPRARRRRPSTSFGSSSRCSRGPPRRRFLGRTRPFPPWRW